MLINLQCRLMSADQTNSVFCMGVSLSVVIAVIFGYQLYDNREESGHVLLLSGVTTKPVVGFFRPGPTKLGCSHKMAKCLKFRE